MNDKKYKWILYTITSVAVITIGIQIYWNYKNYQTNKRQVLNDIQWGLDNALETYYNEISKNSFLTLVNVNDSINNTNHDEFQWDSIIKSLNHKLPKFKTDTLSAKIKTVSIFSDSQSKSDSLKISILENKGEEYDSVKYVTINKYTQLSKDKKTGLTIERNQNKVTKNKVFWGKQASDSLKLVKGLSTIFIALQQDSLDYKKLDTLVNNELKDKGIITDFYINHYKNKSLQFSTKTNTQPDYLIKRQAKSTYLKQDDKIFLNFSNPVLETFQRSVFGIILSTLLVLTVISSLFYLLKIIKHQKHLAEVKNDLISNITHEFKTPIATIGVALESISNFKAIEDKEKTKKYINMSSEQLKKLNIMVEKLLETATLDSDSLELNKEPNDIVNQLNTLINRFKIQYPEKEINSSFKVKSLKAYIDSFHFENALNNILDNAVKYGGDLISVDLLPNDKTFDILISDNGNSLSKANRERIFEKFYRVPKGNTHDVKGFGIGLYYSKTIVEKHNGTLVLDLNKNLTTFKITLPNG